MQTVNRLIESLENAPGPKRQPIQVGRLLVYCQCGDTTNGSPRPCPEWRRGCERYELNDWIDILIRPGGRCDWWPVGIA